MFRRVLLMTLSLAFLYGPSAGAAEWKVGSVSPETVSWGAFTKRFTDLINERSGGKIKAAHYPSMQLGNNTQLAEGVRLGVIEAACVGVPQFSNFMPPYAAFQLPFLFKDFEHIRAFFTSEYMIKQRLPDVEKLGLKALAWVSTANRSPLTKNKFIERPADLKGMKIRVEGNRLLEDVVRNLGANPVSIEFGEVFTSMQTGVVDALVFERQTIAAMKFYEVAKHFSEVGMYPFPGLLVVNLRVWNALDAETRKMVEQAAREAAKLYFDLAAKEDEALVPVLQKAGLKTQRVDQRPFREATEATYKKYTSGDRIIAEIVLEANKLRR